MQKEKKLKKKLSLSVKRSYFRIISDSYHKELDPILSSPEYNDIVFCDTLKEKKYHSQKVKEVKHKLGISEIDKYSLLGCSLDEYCEYIKTFFDQDINMESLDKWVIHHIEPLPRKNTGELDFSKMHFRNTKPMLIKDHSIYHAKQRNKGA